MPSIYVREQGAVIRKRGGRLLLEKDGKSLEEIPLRDTVCVAVFGNVQVTVQALLELLDRGIPLAVLTRDGRLRGHLAPATPGNAGLRLKQYETCCDSSRSLLIARAIVGAKLANSLSLLRSYRSNYPAGKLSDAMTALRDLSARAADASSMSQLLGYEGAGAAVYFDALGLLNRSGLPFPARLRRPPPDPVNSLLSLGYTLVLHEIQSRAEILGLDPYAGFLHQIAPGRPALALDLLEPFRSPLVDRLVLRLVNQRVLQAGDFAVRVGGAGGVVLQPGALPKFLDAYEFVMCEAAPNAPRGMRAVIAKEVEKLAAAIRHQTPFEPWLNLDSPAVSQAEAETLIDHSPEDGCST